MDDRDFEDGGTREPLDANHATDPGTGPVQSNVVRLPRDWLGPREELIPFGPRATQSASVPSPSDFWGERSADMHHALQGPERLSEPSDTGSVPGGDEPVLAERHDLRDERAATRARSSRPDPARQEHHRLTKPQPRRRPRRPRGARSPRWRRWAEQRPVWSPGSPPLPTVRQLRRPLVIGSALAVVAATLVVAAVIGGGRTPSTAGGGLRLSVADLLRGDLSTGRLRLPANLRAARRPRARHTHRIVHRSRRRSSPSGAAVPVSTASSPGSSPSSSSGPTSTGSSVSSSGSTSSSSVSAGSGSGSSSGGNSAASGSSGTTSSSTPGPVGPGAPFGPGHFG